MADHRLVDRVDVEALAHAATDGWPGTLLPRITHIADVLADQLPPDPLPILDAVVRDLPDGQQSELGFDVWPIIELVGRQTATPERTLATIADLGAKAYAEMALRPLLLHDLERTLASVITWTDDPRPGTRRLASEGTRPRLPAVADARITAEPSTLAIGQTTTMTASLTSTDTAPRQVTVDVAVYFPRPSGATTRKVFRWWGGTVEAGGTWAGRRRQHFRDLSTRKHHPGEHVIELLVNGVPVASSVTALHHAR